MMYSPLSLRLKKVANRINPNQFKISNYNKLFFLIKSPTGPPDGGAFYGKSAAKPAPNFVH